MHLLVFRILDVALGWSEGENLQEEEEGCSRVDERIGRNERA
jgi:hypothetical protein